MALRAITRCLVSEVIPGRETDPTTESPGTELASSIRRRESRPVVQFTHGGRYTGIGEGAEGVK